MGTQARARELHAKYAFLVHDVSGGFTIAKFQKCTGLGINFAIPDYAEGGAIAPMKELTRMTVDNFTLERGTDLDLSFYSWALEAADMAAALPEGKGLPSPDLQRDFVMEQLRRDRSTAWKVLAHNCLPAKLTLGEWDNMSDDIQIESLEVATEWVERAGG